MAVLRSGSRASNRRASGLRVGGVSASSFGSSRAARSPGHFGLLSRRGPRVVQGCSFIPAARAVPGCFASPNGPAGARAQRGRFVGSTTAQCHPVGSGVGFAPGVGFWSNCVVKWTCGDVLRMNRPSLAAGHLPRR